jgi:TM2 domain-containing membrane protein YozV
MYSVIGSDGQVYGPVNMPTLEDWCRQGRIKPDTNLIDPIDGRVLRANQVMGLDAIFPTLASYQPPVAQPPMQQQQQPYQQIPGPRPGNQYGQVPIQINNYIGPMHPQQQQPYYPALQPPLRNKAVAILLAFFFGAIGIHRYYMGHNGTATAMLLITVCTCGYGAIITGIWAVVDMILIATGGLLDAQNRPLT